VFLTLRSKSSTFLNVLVKRKSIRKFSSKFITERNVQKIIQIGQRAPTACSLQTYTVIWAKTYETKELVLTACMVPKAIRNVPVVLIICSDTRRLAKTLDYLNADHCLKQGGGTSIKLMSMLDAGLAAQNMVMAAECLGLGSLFIGSAAANQKVIEALKLPEGVVPLTLLLIGYPDEKPPTRPRLSASMILHVDHYKDPTLSEIKVSLKHMNEELDREGYYQKYVNRPSDFHYADHIKRKTSVLANKRRDDEVNKILRRNSFFVDKME